MNGRKILRFTRRIAREIKNTCLKKDLFKRVLWRIRQEIRKKAELKNRAELYRKDYLENLMPVLESMPISNGSRYYGKQKVKIAIIADEFLYDSFKDIAEFIYITPDDYLDYVEEVEFLLVASTWRGLCNEWRFMATPDTENNERIQTVIETYKKAGKTVVFYNKEDPVNYEHFLFIAKKCDVIFTSCVEKVEDYKKDCDNNEVYVMEFCINPVFHNPIGMCNKYRTDGVLFAGAWRRKYPDRVKVMENILDGVIDAGRELIIADRYFSSEDVNYLFPTRYHKFTTKEIPHDYLQKVHKLYNWAINVNSVTDSKTMFANRVYELQANGCLIISSPSIGVKEKFDEVIIVNSKQDVVAALNCYEPDEMYYHQIAGVRRVMTGETNYDRIKTICSALDIKLEKIERKVLVIVERITPQIQAMFDKQTYLYKELVEIEKVLGEKYNTCDIVTRWNENDVYEMFYLEDMINGFKYTNCDYITKACYKYRDEYVGMKEHDYVSEIANVSATVFWRSAISLSDLMSMTDGVKRNNGYSIDHFNYIKR